jgi:hypothetical protein
VINRDSGKGTTPGAAGRGEAVAAAARAAIAAGFIISKPWGCW